MSKQTSLLLTDEALEVVQDYIEQNSCSRNKAVNDLIVLAKNQIGKESVEVRLGKANLKLLKEIKAILTDNEEKLQLQLRDIHKYCLQRM